MDPNQFETALKKYVDLKTLQYKFNRSLCIICYKLFGCLFKWLVILSISIDLSLDLRNKFYEF